MTTQDPITIERDLREFMQSKLYLKRTTYRADEPLQSVVELDSLNIMLIAFHLENAHQIKLKREDLVAGRFRTLNDFIELVIDRQVAKS